ncbi:hypothetical protein [Microviridae sp.]|nr:hypothetical protein [Microviridae sp.]
MIMGTPKFIPIFPTMKKPDPSAKLLPKALHKILEILEHQAAAFRQILRRISQGNKAIRVMQ